jgi:hypothetical protein
VEVSGIALLASVVFHFVNRESEMSNTNGDSFGDLATFAKRLFQSLGMEEDGTCTGRKGIVYVKHEKMDAPRAMAFHDEALKKPVVCDCEHDAMVMILDYVKELLPMVIMAQFSGVSVITPRPEHFMYVFTEDKEEDVEVSSTDEAAAVINFCKEHGHHGKR